MNGMESEPNSTVTCPNGHTVRPGARFCGECGFPFVKGTGTYQVPPASEIPAASELPTATSQLNRGHSGPTPRASRHEIGVGCGFIVAIWVFALPVSFVVGNIGLSVNCLELGECNGGPAWAEALALAVLSVGVLLTGVVIWRVVRSARHGSDS